MVTRYTRWCVSDTWKMINHPVRKGDINYTRTVCESVWRERASVSSWSKVRGYIVDSRVDNGLYRWCRADPPSLYSLNRLLLYVSWLHRFSSLINLYRIALFLLPGGIRVNSIIKESTIWIFSHFFFNIFFSLPYRRRRLVICDSCLKHGTGVYELVSLCERRLINPREDGSRHEHPWNIDSSTTRRPARSTAIFNFHYYHETGALCWYWLIGRSRGSDITVTRASVFISPSFLPSFLPFENSYNTCENVAVSGEN